MKTSLMFGFMGMFLIVLSAFSVVAIDTSDVLIPSVADPAPPTPVVTPVDDTSNIDIPSVADPIPPVVVSIDVDDTSDVLIPNVFDESETQVDPENPTSNPSGSSGGGGGGGCITDWTCTDYSACVNGLQTRTCNKIDSSCSVSELKPVESQVCTVQPATQSASASSELTASEATANSGDTQLGQDPITGAAVGTNTRRNFMIGGLFILGIAVAGILLWKARTRN